MIGAYAPSDVGKKEGRSVLRPHLDEFCGELSYDCGVGVMAPAVAV